MILIYTVGIGTGGLQSDVAQGLSNSIDKMPERPRRVLLVPSASADSVAVAGLINGEHPEISEIVPSHTHFNQPFDFLDCREVFRKAIRYAKEDLSPRERLIVNPTGGTKQMGIGAFLAAAEEEVGEVTFVGGPRDEGTVITGREQNLFFDATQLHWERALRHAESLYRGGAAGAAAQILKPYGRVEKVSDALDLATCLGHWQDLHYVEAAKSSANARGLGPDARTHLQNIRDNGVSALKAMDMLASAWRLQQWERHSDAIVRYCQALEMAAKALLMDGYDEDSRKEGLKDHFKQLRGLGDPSGEAWFDEKCKTLRKLVGLRNEYLHSGKAESPERVRELAAHVKPFIKKMLPGERLEKIDRLWPASLL
jgi:hypothetical protein